MKAEGLKLVVGMPLYLQRQRSDGITEVLPARLLGYAEGQGLIVAPQESFMEQIREGESFTTRLVVGDKRYAFSTELLAKASLPYPHLHLSYPQEIQGVMKRQAPRYAIARPIRFALHVGTTVVSVSIRDISSSGACLVAESQLGAVGDILNIEFRIPYDQSLLNLSCEIRYVMVTQTEQGKELRHGAVFHFRRSEQQLQLEQFIGLLSQREQAMVSWQQS